VSFYEGPTVVTFREREMDSLLNSTTGEVGRHMASIGRKILNGAQRLVGVQSGALKRSLYMRHERTVRGQTVTVGSDLSYAWVHHEGARPHQIVAHGGRLMRFNDGGRIVYARRVSSPGFRGRKYLTIPLERAVRG
jgi:hypothetical protein